MQSGRDQYVYQSIHPADQQKYEDDGWEVYKGGNQKVRMKRLKSHNVFLEDQVWCLFYRMGYPELGGNNFMIRYKRHDGTIGEKKIDVFRKR